MRLRISGVTIIALVIASGAIPVQAQTLASAPVAAASAPASKPAPKAPVAIDQSTPKALMETLFLAVQAGDDKAILQCTVPDYRKAQAMTVANNLRLEEIQLSLYSAMREKFGKQAALELVTTKLSDPNSGLPIFMLSGRLQLVTLAMADGKVDWGRSVRIRQEDGLTGLEVYSPVAHGWQWWQLQKIDGKWHVLPVRGIIENFSPQAAEKAQADGAKSLKLLAKVVEAVSAGIKDGLITPENFLEKAKAILQAMDEAEEKKSAP